MKYLLLLMVVGCIIAPSKAITLPSDVLDWSDTKKYEKIAEDVVSELKARFDKAFGHDKLFQAIMEGDLKKIEKYSSSRFINRGLMLDVPLDAPFVKGFFKFKGTYLIAAMLGALYDHERRNERIDMIKFFLQQADPNKRLDLDFDVVKPFDFGFIYNTAIRLFSALYVPVSFYDDFHLHVTPLALVVAAASLDVIKENQAHILELAQMLIDYGANVKIRVKVVQRLDDGTENVYWGAPLTVMAINARNHELLELLINAGAPHRGTFFDGRADRDILEFAKETDADCYKILRAKQVMRFALPR